MSATSEDGPVTPVKRLLRFFSKGGGGTASEGATTIASGVALNILEWKIVALAFAVVAFLKFAGVSDFAVFMLLWIGDVALSAAILWMERASGLDITFMDTYRRAASRWLGVGGASRVLLALVVLLVMIWYGPAYVASYFKAHLYPRPTTLAVAVVAMAGLQMALWTPAYLAGVDLLTYLIDRFA